MMFCRAATFAILLAVCSVAPAQDDAGFIQLFNGKDLTGWEGDQKFWSVRDGAITGETTKENPTKRNTFLIWRGENGGGKVADFELRAKYKIAGNNNSGIQYRSSEHPDFVVRGYQADLDTARVYTGMLYEEGGRGIIAKPGERVTVTPAGEKKVTGQTAPADEVKNAANPDDWNEYTITAIGNKLVHKINGVTTAEITDEQPEKRAMEGILALQVHQGAPMVVQFKDIRLKVIKSADDSGTTKPADSKQANSKQAGAKQTSAAEKAPQWIWRRGKLKDGDVVYFRKSVPLSSVPAKAELIATCDNEMEVYVNGRRVAQSNQWNQPVFADVTKLLAKGHNAIAVRGLNTNGPAGLLLKLEIDLGGGQRELVVSDATWVTSTTPRDGWNQKDFSSAGWSEARVVGDAGVQPWGDLPGLAGKEEVASATPAENLRLLPGFKAELLYSVPKIRQGSWVAMTFDDKGRIIASDQSASLYRVTLTGAGDQPVSVERLTADIGQAQGLLYHQGSLYVSVNGKAAQGSGFYRVRDTDGDDQFDEVTLLKKFEGAGEHGPHAIRLGPDGKLYVMAGNHTDVPTGISLDSPHKNYDEDLLLPRQPDANGHATGRMAPGGWIVRTDVDGKEWELFSGGFRNSYDFDFNPDGEIFTYDSDMEWDVGLPWYRPTRVNHVTSAAEFGWRYGSGKWPEHYADSLGGYDIGVGSPTGVAFGTDAKFPAKYQRALYIQDWSYGTIHAMHLTPAGSTYTATFDPFVQGRPLPVTDLEIGPDGAMYFTTGGRNTQSGLYRVTYTGGESTEPAPAIVDAEAQQQRALRRKLESFHGRKDPAAIDFAWDHLNSPDRQLRYAARVAIEWQDPSLWADRALAETRPVAATHALLALARTGPASYQPRLLEALGRLQSIGLGEAQKLDLLRVYALSFIRQGAPDAQTRAKLIGQLDEMFPAATPALNRELSELLVYLQSPTVVAKSMKLLASAPTQEEQIQYIFALRNARAGWDPKLRRDYFSWFVTTAPRYMGGNSFKGYLKNIKADAEKTLTPEEKIALADVLEATPVQLAPPEAEKPREFVKEWTMADLEPLLDKVESGRSFEKGREAFAAVACSTCHKLGNRQADVGLGPDITGVGNRFSPRDLLESIIEPSKTVSDLYQTTEIRTADDAFTGRLESDDGKHVVLRTGPLTPPVVIPVSEIKSRRLSPVSTMPSGLLNNLTAEEILDLLAYLRAAGNPNDVAFKK
ncbi:MAG TPA: family 16 glycoside hydrolase [Tepidisphaeraceae bacterium]|nr:family 16 glycoside hydrolase [Tepidisphaeraceae bacterium]